MCENEELKPCLTRAQYAAIRHQGNRLDRLEHNVGERVYANTWRERNRRKEGVNHGYATLELILKSTPNVENMLHEELFVPPISQRDAMVAASVIQWLGTCCGLTFMQQAEAEIRKLRDQDLRIRT